MTTTLFRPFDWFSEKKDSETGVGTILHLEGGIAADFLKGGLTASTEGAVWNIAGTCPLGPIRLAPSSCARQH